MDLDSPVFTPFIRPMADPGDRFEITARVSFHSFDKSQSPTLKLPVELFHITTERSRIVSDYITDICVLLITPRDENYKNWKDKWCSKLSQIDRRRRHRSIIFISISSTSVIYYFRFNIRTARTAHMWLDIVIYPCIYNYSEWNPNFVCHMCHWLSCYAGL